MSDTEWVREGRLGALPDLTSPQALTAFEELLNQADRRDVNGAPPPDSAIEPLARVLGGRLYFNRSRKPRPWPLLRPAHIVRDHAESTLGHLRRLADADPRALSDFEVWTAVEQWCSDAPAWLRTALVFGRLWTLDAALREASAPNGFPFEWLPHLTVDASERSTSAQQVFDLAALAAIARREPAVAAFLAHTSRSRPDMRTALRETTFLPAFDRFIERYGHRGPYEFDWSRPGYGEDPWPILDALRVWISGEVPDLEMRLARRRDDAARAWSLFQQRLSPWRRRIVSWRIRRLVRAIRRDTLWRERIRSDVVRVLAALRGWHLALADRFVQRGWLAHRDDYFLLRFTEIAPIVHGQRGAGRLRAIVGERLAERARHCTTPMPFVLRSSELPGLLEVRRVRARPAETHDDVAIAGQILSGQALSAGVIEAQVVVIHDPGDISRMQPGAILVAPAADPSWITVLALASGLILETSGGVLSPIATLARECGLPALGNAADATTRLRTGDHVRLDATHGRVHRVQPTSAAVEMQGFARTT